MSMQSRSTDLEQAIARRTARVAVIGLGYVGLPLAITYADAGYQVVGIERAQGRVDAANEARSYIEEVSGDQLRAAIDGGCFTATTTFEALGQCDIVSICVPTPLDSHRDPDVSFIRQVLSAGRAQWHSGQLVMLESTTYPGTTNEILVPFFEEMDLKPGRDVWIAFAPERIDPGSRSFGLKNTPRVVGGVGKDSTDIAARFLETVLDATVHRVSSPQVAELTKLVENVFRVVNVSLMNELAQMSDVMGIDLWEAIEAASTKPYGYMPFYPGPGVGGHCIPVDPFYLSWKARESGFNTRFIDLAGEVNDSMPGYVVERCVQLLNRAGVAAHGARVLLLGMAFKKNVSDVRESASIRVARQLAQLGAHVSYHDSRVSDVDWGEVHLQSVPLSEEMLSGYDLVVITTDHDDVDYQMIVRHARLVYDTRRAVKDEHPNVHLLGGGRGT